MLAGTSCDHSGDSGEDGKVNISQSGLSTSPSQINSATSQAAINRLYTVANNSTDSLSQLSELTTSVMRHTSDVKTEPSVISSGSREKLSKTFAEEFHRSVLQTTRQKETTHKSGINGENMMVSDSCSEIVYSK